MGKEKIRKVIETEIKTLEEVKKQIQVDKAEKFADILQETKGNILVTGMGTSGTVARRMTHLLRCVGVSAFFVHPADQQHGASGLISKADTVIAFSNGGETEEVNNYLEIAKERGANLLSITGREDSTMAEIVDMSLAVKVPKEYEEAETLATSSTLAAASITDLILGLIVEKIGFDQDEFAFLHPAGRTGKVLGE